MPKNHKFKCHCGDWRFKNAFFVVDDVREKVCRDLPFYGEIESKQYCVLHYPSKDKAEDFEIVFQERLKEDSWDFRMVYFPKIITYENEDFDKPADFGHAIFSDGIDVRYCNFNERFVFFDSIFLEEVFFTYSHFHGQINFNAADFRDYGYFAGVTFHTKSYPSFNNTKFNKANFSEATFEKSDFGRKVAFTKATFSEAIDFSNAKFFYEVDFKDAEFPQNGKTDFESATFHNGVSFENVEFFDADFKRAKFCYEKKLFDKTIFKYCKFHKSVSFVSAEFYQQVDFEKSTFQNAHFEEVIFAGTTNFREAQFSEDVFFNDAEFGYKRENRVTSVQVNFDGAYFGNNSRVFFDNTWFSWHTSFSYVKFDGYVLFKGSSENLVFDDVFENHAFWGLLDFNHTTVEKPEKFYFQTVRLRPSWFVNSVFDLRKANFVDIDWGGKKILSEVIREELEILEKRIKHNSKKLLAITFRQFADNAENSNNFDEASKFRKLAFETERLIRKEEIRKWREEEFSHFEFINNFLDKVRYVPFDLASSFYRATSFYGEDSYKAFRWLLFIILTSAILYSLPVSDFSGEEKIQSLNFLESIFYSLRVMVLQRPEPFPTNIFAKGVLAIESVIAPLQLALLALAIRRKFMR